ncbi:hypothetical protein CEXT_251871 [Caerostris extrusa]|uniref:C2H2-type domain-containing protein n=1 Tax=Caerostris extrusa TaxID=172846 RepID=A0AAV4WB00_CAEEX|nr:hypothetical protein CEXT_251871 [Caerostris extrusa]
MGFIRKNETSNKKSRRMQVTMKRKHITVCSFCTQQYANNVRLKEHLSNCCFREKKRIPVVQRLKNKVYIEKKISESPNNVLPSNSTQLSDVRESLKNNDASTQEASSAKKNEALYEEDSSDILMTSTTPFDVKSFQGAGAYRCMP